MTIYITEVMFVFPFFIIKKKKINYNIYIIDLFFFLIITNGNRASGMGYVRLGCGWEAIWVFPMKIFNSKVDI